MGGVNAQDGFDYQLWDGLVRLPAWLRNPAFEGVAFEALEDVEARFFAPHAPRGHFIDRFQAKSGDLGPADVRKVIESFREFEIHYPKLARVQTLVTPRIPPTIAWIGRDKDRLDKARPFYAPFPDVINTSADRYLEDLRKEYGDPLATFVWSSVEVSQRDCSDRDDAISKFGVAFTRAYPDVRHGPQGIEAAFDALSSLARKSKGQMLDRSTLLTCVSDSVGASLSRDVRVPINIRTAGGPSVGDAIEIDATRFAGPDFPAAADWQQHLATPLATTAAWLRCTGRQRVRLGGQYRISTAMLLGWSFRSAMGFELDVPTKAGFWTTDDRPGEETRHLTWEVSRPSELVGRRLIVSVGILRDPARDVRKASGVQSPMLTALYRSPIASGKQAQALVGALKSEISMEVGVLGATQIDLFLAVPAAWAVCLGHRWNGLPPTQLHEYLSAERRYLQTVLLR